MNIITRSQWGARPAKSTTPFTDFKLTHIVDHWPGDSRALAKLDSAGLMRAWQNDHMNRRGWRDIGYNYAFDRHGNIFEGRGWNVGGHVLTTREDDQNARSVGFLYMVGNSEEPTDAMLAASAEMTRHIFGRLGRTLSIVPHSDWANKVCPGPFIMPWTRSQHSTLVPPSAPIVSPPTPSKVGEWSPAPAFPLPRCRRHNRQMVYGPHSDSDHIVSGWANTESNGTKGADGITKWQGQMAYRGWSITPDGLWGAESTKVCCAFQAEKGLSVDGLVGPDTWRASWEVPIS